MSHESEQLSLALVQLDLGCLNGSGHAPLLCDQGGNFSMHVMVPLELSCDPPVFLGPGIVVHGHVGGVLHESFEKPIREFSLFVNGDALRGEKLMPVDGLIDANGAQAVEPVQLDVGGKDMHGVIAVRNWDEEIKDISFIFFISFQCLLSSLPGRILSISVLLPVFIGFFQASCMHLTLCQVLALLFECFELFLVVATNFLIFSCNSCQSLCDEEELLPPWQPVSFKSGAH